MTLGTNPRLHACEAIILPTELHLQAYKFFYNVVMLQTNLVATASRVKGLKIIMYLGKVWCG